jgi:methylthioribose-1-phosphate isomerase
MLVNNKYYTAIWFDEEDKKVKIINQLLLPFKFEIKELTSPEDVFVAIKNMEVRGAPLIGITGAFGVYISALDAQKHNLSKDYILEKATYLKSSRPTAVNLFYAIDKALDSIHDLSRLEEIVTTLLCSAKTILEEEILSCKEIGKAGLPLIEEISKKKNGETVNILTHCNAGWIACGDYGTATSPIYLAHNKGIKVHVWVDETRPRNQGARLTSWELGEHGVPHTIIADNTGGHIMQHGMVDIVIVGSDRTTINGDVANKIGTYLKALAAKDNDIPFYAALPSSTIDWNLEDGVKNIPVEERDEEEVKFIEGFVEGEIKKIQLTPQNSPAKNFGFDITPARLVTGIITEKGICEANKESIVNLFPENK